jgi:FAD/FMN-containing dehydrogenase
MENLGLALTNLFLGLCFILYANYNQKISTPFPLLKNNLTWFYHSSTLLCLLNFLKFGFYNMPEGEIHQFINQTLLLSFGYVIYFMLAFILTSQIPSKPRRIRALLLVPLIFYALFSFQWPSFIYSNLILISCLFLLLFYMSKNYVLNPNRQLLLGIIGLFTLVFLTLFQNYLENIFNPLFFILYTPFVLFSSFFLYRGLNLFLVHSPKTELIPIVANNNLNFLTSTYLFQSILPKNHEDIQKILNQAQQYNKSVSCQSSGYSIGGQHLLDNGILINTKKMNFIDFFDSENGVVKVTPSTSWQQLRSFLHHAQKDNADAWAFNHLPSRFLDYSIGGAASSNIHGNRLLSDSLIKNINAIDIIDPSGKMQHINRTLNPLLFKLAIGGYGLFGVIVGIELSLSKKIVLQRSVSTVSIENLSTELDKHIQSGTLYFELYLNTNEKDKHFLQNGILSTYCQVEANPKKIQLEKSQHFIFSKQCFKENLDLLANDKIQKTALKSALLMRKNSAFYWSNDIVPYCAFEKKLHWVNLFFSDYQDYNLIQQTYYLPLESVPLFLKNLSMHNICRDFNLVSASLTMIKKDIESFLHYANQDCAAIELSFYTPKTVQSLVVIKHYLIELTDLVIHLQGNFSLGYTQVYEKSHLLKAYPQLAHFLDLKLRYDPNELFDSNWYRSIKKIMQDHKVDEHAKPFHSIHFKNKY